MFGFEHSEYLYLLFILPVLLLLYIAFQIHRKKAIRKLGDPQLIAELIPEYSLFRNNLKLFLQLFSIALIILALAGPRYGTKLAQVKHEGIDIIIALDISNSMLAEDIRPNRLERAKQELSRLIDKFKNDRIGLIVFAGEAYTQMPITNDYLSARMFLSGITTEMASRQGTAIADAIDLGLRSFNYNSAAGKAIVIISDGENHDGNVMEACKKANSKGVRIFTIGMGSEQGVRIPLVHNVNTKDFQRDREGNFIITRLNQEMLKDIANAGKGKYYHVNTTNFGMQAMLAEMNKLNKADSNEPVYSEYKEQFSGLIWMSLVLLVLELIILERKNKWLQKIKIFDKR